jgi:hypothetical protein
MSFARYLTVEWKLWGRGPLVWILLLIFAGVYYLVAFLDPDDADVGRYALQQSMFLFPVFFVALLLAMYATRREAVTRNGPLLAAMPYRSPQLIAAKLFGIGIPLTLLAWVPALLYAAQAADAGVPASAIRYGVFVLLSSAVPLWYMIALGFVIGSITHKRWSYILGIVVFLLLTYGVNMRLQYWAPYMQIADFTRMSFFYPDSYSKVWGFSRDPVFWMNRAFYLLIAAGLILLLIALVKNRRGEKRLLPVWHASWAACFASAIVIVAFYVGIWSDRMAQIEQEYDVYRSVADADRFAVPELARETEPKLVASDYDLDVTLGGGRTVKVKAKFDVTNVSDETLETVPITLRHWFAVNGVAVDGQPVDWHREPGSDTLRLTPAEPLEPGSSVAVETEYEGEVDIWRREGTFYGFDYKRTYFADRNNVFLPGMIGWYPLAGEHKLASVSEIFYIDTSGQKRKSVHVLNDLVPTVPDTNFSVTVESSSPMSFVFNGRLIEPVRSGTRYVTAADAQRVSGVSLIGGELTTFTETIGDRNVTLIAGAQTDRAKARKRVQQLAQLAERVETEMLAVWGDQIVHRFRPQETFMFVDLNLPDAFSHAVDGTLVTMWDSMNGVIFLPENIGYNLASDVFPYLFNRLMAGNRADAYATEFHELFRAYIDRQYEGGEGPLIDLKRYRAPRTFQLVNEIYDRSDEAQFRAFLKDYFEVLSGDYKNLREREEKVWQFLSETAGERP